MQKNLIYAVILSIALVTLWDVFVMRRFAPQSAPAVQTFQGLAPVKGSLGEPGSLVPAKTRAPREVSFKNENNQITFSTDGASVESWQVKADGEWIEMVLKSPGRAALSTFDGVPFQSRSADGSVVFEGKSPSGLVLRKTFRPGTRFLHELTLEFSNPTSKEIDLDAPLGWNAGLGTDERALADNLRDCRALAYDGRRAVRLPNGPHTGRYPWFGVDNKYFLAALIPAEPSDSTLNVEAPRKELPRLEEGLNLKLKPGERRSLSFQLYLGPKAFDEFKDPRFNLSASANLGVFSGIGKILLAGLKGFHALTGNYGWAIIFLTVCLQCLLLPLTMHSYKHSARMRELQPQIKALQERFKSDPKRMNVEVMNLYQRNGLKFMGMEGCLPMLLQLPFFYAFYAVLRSSYELRGQPWMGWIKDLSVRDPYYILPVLMGAGMLLQQKVGGAVSMDPAQAQTMMLMPIFLAFIFAKLPAGYLLYWFTNSMATLAIQGWMRWRDAREKQAA